MWLDGEQSRCQRNQRRAGSSLNCQDNFGWTVVHTSLSEDFCGTNTMNKTMVENDSSIIDIALPSHFVERTEVCSQTFLGFRSRTVAPQNNAPNGKDSQSDIQ
eukprot:5318413-Amphidinium_carterae.1